MRLYEQIIWLLLLAMPIASISWTITHEEIFKEPRDYCLNQCKNGKTLLRRKFFYLFTCEYCFSHYVTALFLGLTQFTLLINDWRGYVIAEFALVWLANMYMNLYGLKRQDISKEKSEIKIMEQKSKALEKLPKPMNHTI